MQRLFAALPPAESIITTEIEELWIDDWVRVSARTAPCCSATRRTP